MFTGFASENTPAIQVWDFFRDFASTFAISSVSLPDDCAPIQFFRTGATTTAIQVYLPSAPIEGKQIQIVNQQYGSNSQTIRVYSSDVGGSGANINIPIITLGQGDSIVFVYSKQCISFGTSSGLLRTGWLSLNKASVGAFNYNSAVVGGDSNTASNFYCAIVGGSTNTAIGSRSSVVGGATNTAEGSWSSVVGGVGNTASGSYSVILGGASHAIGFSGSFASILGGNTNNASAQTSSVVGGAFGTVRSIQGNFVTPASNSPITGTLGVQQIATLLLGRETTNATATVLTSNASAASTINQVILPNNSAYTFQGTCVANVTGGGTTSGWKFEGVIKRGANAASTTLVAAVTPTVIAQDVGAVTWVLAITADTTNGGIKVTVTGAAATTIRWVAKIETTEVTF